MLNFDEEVKRFQPVLGIGDIEKELIKEDMNDLIDILKKMTISEIENKPLSKEL